MTLRIIASLAAAAVLAACSPQPAAEASSSATASEHPVSGLRMIPLTVTHAGKTHRFRVEVAATPQEQAKGLMFRTEMGPDEGMLFPSDTAEPRSFWMKNTPLPLDIIFIGPDRRIANIAANTTPYSLDSVNSAGAAVAVLELNGGRAAQLGIVAGDKVDW